MAMGAAQATGRRRNVRGRTGFLTRRRCRGDVVEVQCVAIVGRSIRLAPEGIPRAPRVANSRQCGQVTKQRRRRDVETAANRFKARSKGNGSGTPDQ